MQNRSAISIRLKICDSGLLFKKAMPIISHTINSRGELRLTQLQDIVERKGMLNNFRRKKISKAVHLAG